MMVGFPVARWSTLLIFYIRGLPNGMFMWETDDSLPVYRFIVAEQYMVESEAKEVTLSGMDEDALEELINFAYVGKVRAWTWMMR